MSDINNDDIKDTLYKISKEIILPKYKNLKDEDIKLKNNKDLVTSVDVAVEEKLNNVLSSFLPNSLFVGEELYFKDPSILDFYNINKFCWTVDPIDGTTNFVKGKDKFAIMIALTFKEKILQSWIYKPLTGDFYYSKLGEGAFINGKKMNNVSKANLPKTIGSISSKNWPDKYMKNIKNIRSKFKDVNSYGCIGLEYADIAVGCRDFAILSRLFPWDHIPGILLIRESGGSVIHFDKSQYNHTVDKHNLIVTNYNELKKEIMNLITE